MKKEIKLEAELNIETGVYKIKPIEFNKWADFGYWLEALTYMASIARHERQMSIDEIAEYVKSYVLKALNDGHKEINDPSVKGSA